MAGTKRKQEDVDGDDLHYHIKVPRLDESEDKTASRASEPSQSTLLSLLEFTTLSTQEEISARFAEIAKDIIHGHRLIISKDNIVTEYEVLELECYLVKPGCHEDPFTHGSDEQRRSGGWYFHRAPRRNNGTDTSTRTPTAAGGYRGGSRKGLDITLGGPVRNVSSRYFTSSESQTAQDIDIQARGGALLRSIRRVSDNKVISGPSLLVDEVLRASKASNISELVSTLWDGDTAAFRSLQNTTSRSTAMFLRPVHNGNSEKLKQPQIYQSPRIGLDLSHSSIPIPANNSSDSITPVLSHPRGVYVSKPYRFFIHPHLLTANGRGQTFLGVYKALIETESDTQEIQARLVKMTGLSVSSVTKYLEEYRLAKAGGQLKNFVGPSGKGVSATPSSFLKLMGTLERLTNTTAN